MLERNALFIHLNKTEQNLKLVKEIYFIILFSKIFPFINFIV
jgi:hypothetical protein